MTDAELDSLDAFLAEKVMGWRFDPATGFYPSNGRDRSESWSATRSASDAEEVREKWLRCAKPFGRTQALAFTGEQFMADALHDGEHRYVEECDSLRLAELLAIARACWWKS